MAGAPSVGYLCACVSIMSRIAQRQKGPACWIPCTEKYPPIGRVLADLSHDLCELIDALAGVVCVGVRVWRAKMPPLEAIHRTQITLSPMPEPARVEERA
jgi:hypothetical protein